MSEGIVPDGLKIANILPVHKSNAKDDISNDTPISLLPAIYKILGKVVYQRTFHFIQTNKILNDNQYGFRDKHSTINAITALTTDVMKALARKRFGIVCIIMFTGVYPIIYLIFLHLPMTYTFTKLDKPHIYVLLLL